MGRLDIFADMVASCRRAACGRGFGVQSPSAYRFVRYVAGEAWPYYAYDALDDAARTRTTERERRLFRFYLRLANYVRPHCIVECADALTPVRETYLRAGCHKAEVRVCADTADIFTPPLGRPALARVTAERRWRPLLDAFCAQADAVSALVVEGIARDAGARTLWEEMTADPRTSVAYDMGDCGVVMFDTGKYKRVYRARL